MATLEQNAEIIKSTARGLRAIIEMADQIADLKGVRASIDELQRAQKDTTEDLYKAKKELADTLADVERNKAAAKSILEDAQMKRKELLDRAKEAAKTAEDKAKAKAAEDLKGIKEMEGRKEYLSGELASLLGDIEEAKAELGRVRSEIAKWQEAVLNMKLGGDNG